MLLCSFDPTIGNPHCDWTLVVVLPDAPKPLLKDDQLTVVCWASDAADKISNTQSIEIIVFDLIVSPND
jgi:hypothetical protein